MKKLVAFLTPFVLIALILACSKIDKDNYSTDNEHIKSISMNGAVVHKYLYDVAGRIVEENSSIYFKRFLYDKNDRLVKVEEAWDNAAILSLSSSALVERTEFMTSQNSTVSNYTLYEYDKAGLLSKTKHYFKPLNDPNGKFELRSIRTFEYEGSNIVKVNGCDETGKVNQYWIYTYDKNGNVINEKNYSNNFGQTNELVRETTYKYDNYKNPYHIFSMLGSPGLWSNVNNIIETRTTMYLDAPGVNKYSTSKTTYQYNSNDYPEKAIYGDSVEEYKY